MISSKQFPGTEKEKKSHVDNLIHLFLCLICVRNPTILMSLIDTSVVSITTKSSSYFDVKAALIDIITSAMLFMLYS